MSDGLVAHTYDQFPNRRIRLHHRVRRGDLVELENAVDRQREAACGDVVEKLLQDVRAIRGTNRRRRR